MQARRMKSWFRRLKVNTLFSSTLIRAKETAAIIRHGTKTRLHMDRRINELSFGCWEGKTAKELLAAGDPAFYKWAQGYWTTPKGGESLLNFKKRISEFLTEILDRYHERTIAVVAHGGSIRMMLLLALKMLIRHFWAFQIKPASVSTLIVHQHTVQLVCLNDILDPLELKRERL